MCYRKFRFFGINSPTPRNIRVLPPEQNHAKITAIRYRDEIPQAAAVVRRIFTPNLMFPSMVSKNSDDGRLNEKSSFSGLTKIK
jgi:hypothetical protein